MIPAMLILLPPSEGKWQPVRGKPLDLGTLCHPELTMARASMIDALATAAARDDAPDLLGVPAGRRDAVWDNTLLRTLPTAPAGRIYTGVLYDALDLESLDAAARRRAAQRLLIFSALFGVLRVRDRVPAYRLAADVTLPGVGRVSAFWREPLAAALGAPAGPIVDCRSGIYTAMWRPPGAIAVRVFREQDGRRTVVSHMAKHARGLVARALVASASAPTDSSELVDVLDAFFAATPVTTATGAPFTCHVEATEATLDVVTRPGRR